MYWIWIIFTSPNEYLLDRGLRLVAKDTDCIKHVGHSKMAYIEFLCKVIIFQNTVTYLKKRGWKFEHYSLEVSQCIILLLWLSGSRPVWQSLGCLLGGIKAHLYHFGEHMPQQHVMFLWNLSRLTNHYYNALILHPLSTIIKSRLHVGV